MKPGLTLGRRGGIGFEAIDWAAAFLLILLAHSAIAVPGDDWEIPLPEQGDSTAPPAAPNRLRFFPIESERLVLYWDDASKFEDHYDVFFAPAGEDLILQERAPAQDGGSGSYAREDLDPDTDYCFGVQAVNRYGRSALVRRCEYTRDTLDNPVLRVQLAVLVADRAHAGTDSTVRVQLDRDHHGWWLDGPEDDFNRGTRNMMDVPVTGISELEDINRIRLAIDGDDAMCVSKLQRVVNQRPVAEANFGDADCHWVGDGSHLLISHELLRAGADWDQSLLPSVNEVGATESGSIYRYRMDAREMTGRIEGLVGHAIFPTGAYWGELNGDGVEVRQLSNSRLGVDLDLAGKADSDYLPDWLLDDPEIDIDFAIGVGATLNDNGKVIVEVSPEGFRTDVDANWATEFVFDILPCGVFASLITGDGIPGCASHLERSIERDISAQIRLAAQRLEMDTGDAQVRSVEARVTTDAAIEVDFEVVFSAPGPVNEAPTRPDRFDIEVGGGPRTNSGSDVGSEVDPSPPTPRDLQIEIRTDSASPRRF